MSKGSRRRMFKAIANRKRNPEMWGLGMVDSVTVKKNKVIALLPRKGSERGRDA